MVGKEQTWRCHIDQLKEAMEVSTPDFNFDPSSLSEQEEPMASDDVSLADSSEEASGSSESESEAASASVPIGHRYPLRDRAKHQRFKL